MNIEVKHPDRLKESATRHQVTTRLIAQGLVPPNILGWFVVTMCLNMLRAVYGSDAASVAALRAHIADKEAREIEIKTLIAHGESCTVANCITCGEYRELISEPQ